jgi:hypothetical protein
MIDPIVDEVRRLREELIQKHGGLAGYLRFCAAQDRPKKRGQKRRPKAKSNRRKPAARATS